MDKKTFAAGLFCVGGLAYAYLAWKEKDIYEELPYNNPDMPPYYSNSSPYDTPGTGKTMEQTLRQRWENSKLPKQCIEQLPYNPPADLSYNPYNPDA